MGYLVFKRNAGEGLTVNVPDVVAATEAAASIRLAVLEAKPPQELLELLNTLEAALAGARSKPIQIVVGKIQQDAQKVQLLVDAPRSLGVHRSEVNERIRMAQAEAR